MKTSELDQLGALLMKARLANLPEESPDTADLLDYERLVLDQVALLEEADRQALSETLSRLDRPSWTSLISLLAEATRAASAKRKPD